MGPLMLKPKDFRLFSATMKNKCGQWQIFHSVQPLKHAPVIYATPYRRFKLAAANQLFRDVRIRLAHHKALMKKFCMAYTILTPVHCSKTMGSFDRQISSEVFPNDVPLLLHSHQGEDCGMGCGRVSGCHHPRGIWLSWCTYVHKAWRVAGEYALHWSRHWPCSRAQQEWLGTEKHSSNASWGCCHQLLQIWQQKMCSNTSEMAQLH